MHYDPYDIRIAFDDLYARYPQPTPARVVGADLKRVTGNILRRARQRRLAAPLQVRPVRADPTARSFQLDGRSYEVLGGAQRCEELATGGLPLYAAALRCFQSALPAPKFVRVDTPSTYARFREQRHAACCDELHARVAELESLLSQHVADRHGDGRLAALESTVARLAEQRADDSFRFGDYPQQDLLGGSVGERSADGATRIAVVPALRGKVECWQDGEEICCTVRFLNPRGELRLATTGTPMQRHLEEALSCASVAELEHALPVMGRLAQILGSTALIPELCRVAPILSTTGQTSPMIGVMFPQSTSVLPAAMALLQQCQRGDRRAWREVRSMERRGGGDLLAEAASRLSRAQRVKAQMMTGGADAG